MAALKAKMIVFVHLAQSLLLLRIVLVHIAEVKNLGGVASVKCLAKLFRGTFYTSVKYPGKQINGVHCNWGTKEESSRRAVESGKLQ